MGWDNARIYFYSALTSGDNAARESYFAKTFQSAGQVMHLLQDMAVPAHVRNDFWNSHIWTGGTNPYELYVQNHIAKITSLTREQISSATPTFTNPKQTDFWDTSDDSVIVPVQIFNTTLQSKAGLAEYTNANFVSEGTHFSNSDEFEYPTKSSTDEVVHTISDPFDPGATVKRPYYYKARDWEVGYHLAGVNYTYFYNPNSGTQSAEKIIPPLDDYVHMDCAEKLLPRAVGYSAALLDYFFRGEIEISIPDQGVYAITGPTGSFDKIRLKARNKTADNEEMGAGIVQAVVKYKIAQADPFTSAAVPVTKDFSYAVSPAVDILSLPTDTAIELEFDLSGNPIPLYATDVYLQVVFKGRLGNEQDAVAVGFKDISEPTPLDIINDMDRVHISRALYTAGSPEAVALADPLWDIYAHEVRNVYFKFSSSADPEDHYASSAAYDYFEPAFIVAPGTGARALYVLGDEQFKVSVALSKGYLDERDSYRELQSVAHWISVFNTKRRQDVLRNPSDCGYTDATPCYVQEYLDMLGYRDRLVWNGFKVENQRFDDGNNWYY